jgi:hypothetical protein
MKCKHCGKDIYKYGNSWQHKFDGSIYCYDEPIAEPIEDWTTPTEGPKLQEVEVRQDDEDDWEEAVLMFVDTKYKHHPAYFAKRVEDNCIDYFAQCRMRKDNE